MTKGKSDSKLFTVNSLLMKDESNLCQTENVEVWFSK